MYITAGRAEEHDARECSVAARGSDFGKLRHLCFADMSVCSNAHISFCQSLQFSVEVSPEIWQGMQKCFGTQSTVARLAFEGVRCSFMFSQARWHAWHV